MTAEILAEGDLLLMRHGESEGNAANRLSEKGYENALTSLYEDRHSYHLRLSAKGCEQANATSQWFAKHHVAPDNLVVSEYTRAKETAVLVDIPNATWSVNRHLVERDWGELEGVPGPERERSFMKQLRAFKREPFYWRPWGGETMAEVCERVNMFLVELALAKPKAKTLVVCHGEVMWAFRIVLENLSVRRFKELHFSHDSLDQMWNCQMLHYTWQAPPGKAATPRGMWRRIIRPTTEPAFITEFEEIKPVSYTNAQLLAEVALHPRHFGDK
jgi:NAD+ kinase